jgi:hypothetical protein
VTRKSDNSCCTDEARPVSVGVGDARVSRSGPRWGQDNHGASLRSARSQGVARLTTARLPVKAHNIFAAKSVRRTSCASPLTASLSGRGQAPKRASGEAVAPLIGPHETTDRTKTRLAACWGSRVSPSTAISTMPSRGSWTTSQKPRPGGPDLASKTWTRRLDLGRDEVGEMCADGLGRPAMQGTCALRDRAGAMASPTTAGGHQSDSRGGAEG